MTCASAAGTTDCPFVCKYVASAPGASALYATAAHAATNPTPAGDHSTPRVRVPETSPSSPPPPPPLTATAASMSAHATNNAPMTAVLTAASSDASAALANFPSRTVNAAYATAAINTYASPAFKPAAAIESIEGSIESNAAPARV
eukprot:13519-Pelagococcus_subviridis.AAC.3